MRLIDADALKREMQRLAWNLEDTAESMGEGLLRKRLNTISEGVQRGIDMLNEQPTIEERKTGKWEYNTSSCGSVAFIHRKCSECGYESMGMGTKYCPDCGARMGDVEE